MMQAKAFFEAAERLPWTCAGDLIGPGGLVVVAPHPDDESLGCGGLIAKASALGVAIRVIVVSDGIGSHSNSPSFPPERLRALRESEAKAAIAALGLTETMIQFLRLSDRAVPAFGDMARDAATAIARTAADCRATALCVTWRHDPHCDHAASAAIVELARPLMEHVRILSYPVWGWTLPPDQEVDGPPNGFRLDISEELIAKKRAVEAHRSQLTDLIGDDPSGFRLDETMLTRFSRPFEIYLETPAHRVPG